MKKRTLLTCGLAAALFAGCSSDDKLTVDDGTVSNSGTGYLALNISLPSTSANGSRSDEFSGTGDQSNDKFNQGTAKEYNVNNLYLICYESGTAVQAFEYTATDLAWSTPPTDASGITTDAVLKVEPVDEDVTHVLVLINKPDDMTIELKTGKITYKSNVYTKFTDGTNGFDNVLLEGDLTGGGDKFFMSNAPLSDGSKVVTLVSVKPKPTAAEAQADIRTVHVERAVGKVNMAHATTGWSNWKYSVTATGYSGDKVTFNKWLLDIKNIKTYAVRQYDKAWESLTGLTTPRFFGDRVYACKDELGNSAMYGRTYWAKDHNYNNTYTAGDFSKVQTTDFTALSDNMDTKLYCNENTFQVKNMEQRQSTRVVLQATYKPYKEASWKTESDGTWYRLGNSNTPYNATEVNALIKKVNGCSSVEIKTNLGGISNQKFTANELNNLDLDPTTQANQLAAINKALGSLTVYAKGICYYVVRIQHFGDKYTPWTAGENYITNEGYAAISNPDAKYLGRYGILRNNWYEIEINKVSSPGDATIPDPDKVADDVQNYYIQANVKIMDWAVRKQSVNL